MIERQELHCHGCDQYVQFDLDLSLNGNHVLTCPKCGHEHCRVVRNGRITGDRWDSRNVSSYAVGSVTTSAVSTFSSYAAASTAGATVVYGYGAWMNTTGGASTGGMW